MAKITELTQTQIDRFPEFRDKWIEIGLCTDPANRKEAERGIQLAYKCAGLAPPRRIVWTTDPLSNALARITSDQDFGGDVWASIWESILTSVYENIEDKVRRSVRDNVWASVRESVDVKVRDSVWGSAMDSAMDSFGDYIRESVGGSVCGQNDAPSLSTYDYFKEVCGLVKETSKLEGLWLISKNAGWYRPHENICFISERHNILVRDDAGRPHCEDGPAIAYPDGWSIYCWHGVHVPHWIITNSEKITIEEIHSETNAEWRRCMIERIGPENYLPKSGAEKVGTDECGTLWRRDFGDDVWCVVEVINGTREQDGSYKKYYLQVPPEMQTAREAVAWTYGLSENEYKVTLRT